MPTNTFYNLANEKQDKLMDAAIKEFSKFSIYKSSINRILADAKIPKGSFYQYFHDKAEFYWYTINTVVKDQLTPYDTLLEDCNGDLFVVEERQLNEIIDLLQDYRFSSLLRNMFLYSYHEMKQKVFDQSEVDFSLMYQIHVNHQKEKYKVKDEHDFQAFYDMLRTLSNACILGVVSNQYSEEYAKEVYKKQLQYIKDGLAT
jgi:AcrR family transcriptional regulator